MAGKKNQKKKNKRSRAVSCLGGEQCKLLGYCVRAKAREEEQKEEWEKSYRMDSQFICKLVPLSVNNENSFYVGNYSKKHLQTAFDAFHQQDYETTILHSKAVIQENAKCGIAYVCLAVSEYYLQNYEDANYYMTLAEEHYYNYEHKVIQLFGIHCQNIHREKLKEIELSKSQRPREKVLTGSCVAS